MTGTAIEQTMSVEQQVQAIKEFAEITAQEGGHASVNEMVDAFRTFLTNPL